MNGQKVVFICEDTPDGVFTAIYDVWTERIPREQMSLRADGAYTYELFTEYREIETDLVKAEKVARSVRAKISYEAYRQIYAASLAAAENKVDLIFDFLKLAFRVGSSVTDMHARDEVCALFELSRKVTNEAHLYREFARFSELENGVLLARIQSANFVLPLIADHFADRFPEENFAIIDDDREMGLFHERRKQWLLSPIDRRAMERIWASRGMDEYERLWKIFFHTIAIEPRRNERCQRTLCALHYRKYMPEFADG